MTKEKASRRWKSLSKNRKACSGKRVIVATVRLIVCGVTTNQEAANYISEAVELWGGQFEPPTKENNFKGDPLHSRYTHLVDVQVRGSRLSQDDVTSYLAEDSGIWEYPDNVN